jgi:hypothetical protein
MLTDRTTTVGSQEPENCYGDGALTRPRTRRVIRVLPVGPVDGMEPSQRNGLPGDP